jgi:hypothetical protein
MPRTTKSQTRLYALIASHAPVGVIFRRGPSKSVLLSKWDLRTDTFERGQWFKGRIYERRCDLSADGELLMYFAANYKKPLFSWTAISRPPFLKALMLWEKGDGWGGGGLFSAPRQILLNHRSNEMIRAAGLKLPESFIVKPLGERSGWGEDDPIWSMRLRRDGWKMVQLSDDVKPDWKAKVVWKLNIPTIWQKPHPLWPERYSLQMAILGIHERNGPLYQIDYDLVGPKGDIATIGRCDWADWNPNGDLVFAQSGCIYRLSPKHRRFGLIESSRVIADFSDLRFQPVQAPPEATVWPKALKPKRKQTSRNSENRRSSRHARHKSIQFTAQCVMVPTLPRLRA